MTNLKQKLAELHAEVKALQKQIADAESYYPKEGDVGYCLHGNGGIMGHRWCDDAYDRAVFDQGNWLATEREAELTRDYRAAVTRINCAIRAGERGDASPWLHRDYLYWDWGNNINPVFCSGSANSIESVIKANPAEFAAIREYQRVVLERGE